MQHELAGNVVADASDEACDGAEVRGPGSDVCGLAARRGDRLRRLVVAGDELAVEPDDDVEEEVAERRDPHAPTTLERHGRRRTPVEAPLLRDRGACRRGRRARDRAPRAPTELAPAA